MDASKNEGFIYRFRSVERALEKGELEREEVYFSSLSDLNDPAEGYKDLFFNGDEILWENFFANYLICLHDSYIIFLLEKDDFEFVPNNIPIFRNITNFPTELYRTKINEIFDIFFDNESIHWLIKGLSSRPNVRREEVQLYLGLIHLYGLALIRNANGESVTTNELSVVTGLKDSDFFNLIVQMEKENNSNEKHIEQIFLALSVSFKAIKTSFLQGNKAPSSIELKKLSLISDFPTIYVNALERIMYPECYTTSFVSDVNNPSMWGYYGDGHKGICLKFKHHKDKKFLKGKLSLKTVTSWSSSKNGTREGYNFVPFEFYEVDYSSNPIEVDFFTTIGNLSFHALKESWFTDRNGKVSSRYSEISEKEDSWRRDFWKKFNKIHLRKDSNWKHEKEYRLLLSSIFNDVYDEPEKRALKYDFNDLEGVIFGQKILKSEKYKIIELMNKKCSEYKRESISFYDSVYDPIKGSMSYYKINFS